MVRRSLFWFVQKACLEFSRADDPMRSPRRARPGVCIGRNDRRVKFASTETCGLFLNADLGPTGAMHATHRDHTQVHVYTHAHEFLVQTQAL